MVLSSSAVKFLPFVDRLFLDGPEAEKLAINFKSGSVSCITDNDIECVTKIHCSLLGYGPSLVVGGGVVLEQC